MRVFRGATVNAGSIVVEVVPGKYHVKVGIVRSVCNGCLVGLIVRRLAVLYFLSSLIHNVILKKITEEGSFSFAYAAGVR
jgi:sorbitol-specific phosphotransferase system component IIC